MLLRLLALLLMMIPAAAARAQVDPIPLGSGKQPQIAVDAHDQVHVVFGTPAGAILYAHSRDDGAFTKPLAIPGPQTGRTHLGARRGPRIAAAGDALVISAIFGNEGGGAIGELLTWRSTDGGQTWAAPVTATDAPECAREGLHHLAASPDGKVLMLVWLDLRSGKTALYGTRSGDGGATWEPNRPLYRSPDGTICECCQPSVTFDAKGNPAVMFRNFLDGNRDLYLLRSADGGETFQPAQKLGEGSWPLNACPMDGGAIAFDADGTPLTVWRRMNTVYSARPGKPEVEIGEGRQPWLAVREDGPHLVWLGPKSSLMYAAPGADPVVIAAAATDPVIAARTAKDAPLFVAWEADGKVYIARLDPPRQ